MTESRHPNLNHNNLFNTLHEAEAPYVSSPQHWYCKTPMTDHPKVASPKRWDGFDPLEFPPFLGVPALRRGLDFLVQSWRLVYGLWGFWWRSVGLSDGEHWLVYLIEAKSRVIALYMGETSSCRLKDTLDVDLRRCLKIDIRSSSLNTDSLATMAYLHDFLKKILLVLLWG